MERGQKPLVVLSGPTAVGKTELSLDLAERIGGEIISADSIQVYRGMDVGSAKPPPKERRGIRHYLIDVLDPSENFNVFRFQEMAKAAMEEIWSHGHIPILTGGTGFYTQSVIYDIGFTENDGSTAFRSLLENTSEISELLFLPAGLERYEKVFEEWKKTPGEHSGKAFLHACLACVDPAYAKEIHQNNVKRVIRALEFQEQTGENISLHNEEQRKRESPYNFAHFVLTDDRAEIYRRIDDRVDVMMQMGLLDEVKRLKNAGVPGDGTAMQGIGYREILGYLNGEYPLEEAVRLIKRNTRHFAKRQLTWFRRERDIVWIDRRDYGRDQKKILEAVLRELSERKIINLPEDDSRKYTR